MNTRLCTTIRTSFVALARPLLLVIAALVLSACSGGGGDDSGTGNRAPTAIAGGDQTAPELLAVQLSGSGSDPDAGDTVSFSWSQIGGTTVTLNNATTANADFVAPDVAAGVPEILTFQLTVTDTAGLFASDSAEVTVQEPVPVVTISGNMRYEFPPPGNNCNGLNFGNIELRPIRQATVQVLDSSGTNVLDSDVTDDLGAYSVAVNASTDVILRVRAELKKGGSPSWDVEVRNNVVDPLEPNPPALGQRPMYVMDAALNSGVIDQALDLTATTGWDGSSYSDPRVAAPFAVLDAIYSAVSLVVAADATANFAPLDAFWSPDNTATDGVPQDIDSGELGTSFYRGDIDSLFLLGKEGVDAEEFDDHVIVHEWGHYFEDNFSRSDSIGGSHTVGDELDMRVAFGEGFATALSGMALNNSNYCDTLWSGGANPVLTGFRINIEGHNPGNRGWFNEISVMRLIYDLWDTSDDGADNSSIGFGPIYDAMTGPQAATSAFTSIFPFATELKQSLNGPDNTFVDALLTEQVINPDIDIWGSSETNNGGASAPGDVLPIYEDLILGVTKNVCTNSQFDSGRDGNKLSEHRYLRLNLPTAQQVTFTVTANPAPSTPPPGFDCTVDPNDPESHTHSDPDIIVWQNGNFIWWGASCQPNSEVTTTNGALSAGDYLIDLNEFRHEDEDTVEPFDEQVCFDFTAN